MLCPYCRLSLRPIHGGDPKKVEYVCAGCGYKHIENRNEINTNINKSPISQDDVTESGADKKISPDNRIEPPFSIEDVRAQKAKKKSELTQLTKSLRTKLKELQEIAQKIEKTVTSIEDQ